MKTKTIKDVIKKLKPAFKTNDISEFGEYVYFLEDRIMAYNGDVCIIVPTENKQEVALPVDEFEKFVNRVSSDEIIMTIGDNVELKAGRAKATFAINSDILDKVKQINIQIPNKFTELPTKFIDGIKLTRHSISKDKGREDQTFLKVDGNILASTDNFRVSEYVLDSDMESMFIPRDVLQYLISYNVKEYAVNEGVVYFKTEDDIYFMTRLGDVNFVEYKHLFEVQGNKFTFPKGMADMIDTASITVDGIFDIDKMVKVVVSDGVITVSSKNNVGKVEVEEKIDDKATDASFFVNPEFMLDILKVTNEAIITDNLILFTIEGFRQLIALFEE